MKKILKNIGLFVFSFMLLILRPLKTYAAAPVPVIPEGFNPVVIQGGGAGSPVPVSPDVISSLLIALGIQIEDIVRSNVENVVGSPEDNVVSIFSDPNNQDSLREAFNEADNTNHSLGDDLYSWLKTSELTKSSNGHQGKLTVPRDLWDRLNKATSDGLTYTKYSYGSVDSQYIYDTLVNPNNISEETFNNIFSFPCVYTFSYFGNLSSSELGYPNLYIGFSSYFEDDTGYYAVKADQTRTEIKELHADNIQFMDVENNCLYRINTHSANQLVDKNGLLCWKIADKGYTKVQLINVYTSNSSSQITTQTKLNINQPFKNAKLDNYYDVIGKSSTINPNNGKIEGPVRLSILNAQQLQQLQDLINQGILTIGEALNRLNLFAYDQNSGILIDNSLSPDQAIDALAQGIADPSPTEPSLEEAFKVVDGWDPVVPAPDLPFTGGMSWIAAQMQTMLTLTNFQNIWLVISTLAVAMLIIGMKRLWK